MSKRGNTDWELSQSHSVSPYICNSTDKYAAKSKSQLLLLASEVGSVDIIIYRDIMCRNKIIHINVICVLGLNISCHYRLHIAKKREDKYDRYCSIVIPGDG